MDYDGNVAPDGTGETKIALHLIQHLRDPCVCIGSGCATDRCYTNLAREFWESAVSSCAKGIIELELEGHQR